MTTKKRKSAHNKPWAAWITFDWQGDRLVFHISDSASKKLYIGQALQGSLNEIAAVSQDEHCRMSYALLTTRQMRQWLKTGKPPRNFPA